MSTYFLAFPYYFQYVSNIFPLYFQHGPLAWTPGQGLKSSSTCHTEQVHAQTHARGAPPTRLPSACHRQCCWKTYISYCKTSTMTAVNNEFSRLKIVLAVVRTIGVINIRCELFYKLALVKFIINLTHQTP